MESSSPEESWEMLKTYFKSGGSSTQTMRKLKKKKFQKRVKIKKEKNN